MKQVITIADDDRHDSAIGWLHRLGYIGRTWNPIAGCTHKSRGCLLCYADKLHTMRHRLYVENAGLWPKSGKPMPAIYAEPFTTVRPWPAALEKPLHWRQPSFIFISMSDLFHEDLPEDYIRQVFAVMADERCSHHIFQVLTKRAERLAELALTLPWRANIQIGVSIEDGRRNGRVDGLATVKAVAPRVITTVSAEPLLGSLVACPRPLDLSAVDWVITGAESGLMPDGRQRAMQEAWVRELRDLCLAHTPPVPFFYKQKATPKGGKVEAPELDGRQWLEWPTLYSVRGAV